MTIQGVMEKLTVTSKDPTARKHFKQVMHKPERL
jgi:hypothetical protein